MVYLSSSVSAWLPLLFGTAIIIMATALAVAHRKEPGRLIIWGGVHDLGVMIAALGSPTAIALTGIWIYLIFQLCARLLAWFGLRWLEMSAYPDRMAPGLRFYQEVNITTQELTGMGRALPWAGSFFALGLMAAVGGSPFLLPEGRALIISGILETLPFGAMTCMMIMAACTTAFIWLYVDCMRRICLEKLPDGAPAPAAADKKPEARVIILGVIVALLGIFRNPVTDFIGLCVGIDIPHSTVQASYWIYYIGAFATGVLFLVKWRYSRYFATLCFAIAFAVVCASPAGPLANLFLFIISFIGLVVAIYSISYIHDDREGWYWFFLLLTFASLAAIVSASNVAAMFGYWELMTYASYFLVAHEGNKSAFAAALKYYVMCAGGAIFMLPGLMALGVFAVQPFLAFQFPSGSRPD